MKIKRNNKLRIFDFNSHSTNWLMTGGKIVREAKDADLIVFPGGGDIDPSIYGERKGMYTMPSYNRDKEESEVWAKYANKKPMIGICRGMQLLFSLEGAKLVQHIQHTYHHLIKTIDDKRIVVNSLHHQQVCFDDFYKPYTLLGWSLEMSPIHLNGYNLDYEFGKDYKEPEAACLNNIIGFQYHPEMMDENNKAVEWSLEMCEKYLEI